MTVKDIIYYASLMCGKEKLAEQIAQGVLPDDNPDAVRFLNCYNLTVMELSEEIEPLIYCETLSSPNGVFYYTSFTKPPKRIVSVSSFGREIAFTVFHDRVETGAGVCEITYDYRSAKASSLADECEYDENVFSARVLAMGVAAEFLLVSGLYDEAATWRERYEKAIETHLISKSKRIRGRVWL